MMDNGTKSGWNLEEEEEEQDGEEGEEEGPPG